MFLPPGYTTPWTLVIRRVAMRMQEKIHGASWSLTRVTVFQVLIQLLSLIIMMLQAVRMLTAPSLVDQMGKISAGLKYRNCEKMLRKAVKILKRANAVKEMRELLLLKTTGHHCSVILLSFSEMMCLFRTEILVQGMVGW